MLIFSQEALDAAVAKLDVNVPAGHTLAVVATLDSTGATAGLVFQKEGLADLWTLKGEGLIHMDLSGNLSGGARVVFSR